MNEERRAYLRVEEKQVVWNNGSLAGKLGALVRLFCYSVREDLRMIEDTIEDPNEDKTWE